MNDGRYMAKIINQKTIGFENLLKEMENNTALRKEDIRLAIAHFVDAVRENLVRGLKVETPFAETNNHEVRVAIQPAKAFEESVIAGIAIEKVLENNVKYPKAFEFKNLNAPDNAAFKPTNIIGIIGINLKIDATADDEGVFWIDEQGKVTKTDLITMSTNTALQFQIPELAPGMYGISIAARLGNHVLRSTTLEEHVTIS